MKRRYSRTLAFVWLREILPRGLALFLGVFTALNLILHPGYDVNRWWVDLRILGSIWTGVVGTVFLGACAILMIAWSLWPRTGAWRRRLTRAIAMALTLTAFANALVFFVLLYKARIVSAYPFPLSLFIAIGMLAIFQVAGRPSEKPAAKAPVVLAAGVFAVSFALAQMVAFGNTDYRRAADVAVVFGARAYPDGRPSLSLSDRVLTGVELYQRGFVRFLILSGGADADGVHESHVMRRVAMENGVPEAAILLDEDGVNTAATVHETSAIFRSHGFDRVLAVSHSYHLPRVKLAYQRAGVEVYTVPAVETRTLAKQPYFMAREVLALVRYWLWV